LVAKHFTNGAQFGDVAHRCAGAMGVDVVNRRIHRGHSLTHAACGAFTTGGNHIVAVRGGAVTNDLGKNIGAARFGVFQFFDHQHAATAGDNKTVSVRIIGTG